MTRPRVFLVDDHELIRSGIKAEIAHAVEGNQGALLLAVDVDQAERFMHALRDADFGVVRER